MAKQSSGIVDSRAGVVATGVIRRRGMLTIASVALRSRDCERPRDALVADAITQLVTSAA